MTSPAKIESNRRNALHSTGPKTIDGKAKSSKNAIKHGLTSAEVVLPDEDPETFEVFRDELAATLAPVGPLECVFADRLITAAWRLRRVSRLESDVLTFQMFDAQAAQARTLAAMGELELLGGGLSMIRGDQGRKAERAAAKAEAQRDARTSAAGLIRDAAGADVLTKLSRYERTLERTMYRAHHELQRLQAARSGQNVPLPAVVDVDV